METFKTTSQLLVLCIGLITTSVALYRLSLSRFEKRLKIYEIYKDIKSALNNENKVDFNLIDVALGCINVTNLGYNEVDWFMNTPRAFQYIETYSKNKRWLEISEKSNKIVFRGNLKNVYRRILSYISFLTIYALSAGFGITTITYGISDFGFNSPSIFLIPTGTILLLFGIISLWIGFDLMSLKKITKESFNSDKCSLIYVM